MKNKDYCIEKLWLVHKRYDGFRESFICRESEKGLVEIFSGSLISLEKDKFYLVPLSTYYSPITRMFYSYKDLSSLLNKLNRIIYLNFIKSYNPNNDYTKLKEFTTQPVKWYKYELLKWYNLNNLFIVNNDNNLYMCRYSIIINSYIDIFTDKKIDGSVCLLTDFLKINGIKCDYQKLNIYSLLRLYQKINIVNKYLNRNTEEIVINELKNKGIYEKSRIYKVKKKLP